MSLVQTEDRRFVRDTRTYALLNTDRAALAQHRRARQVASQQTQVARDVRDLQTRVDTLTGLVQQLLDALASR